MTTRTFQLNVWCQSASLLISTLAYQLYWMRNRFHHLLLLSVFWLLFFLCINLSHFLQLSLGKFFIPLESKWNTLINPKMHSLVWKFMQDHLSYMTWVILIIALRMHYVVSFWILEVDKKKECLVKSCRNREEQGLSRKGKVRNNNYSQLPRNKKNQFIL